MEEKKHPNYSLTKCKDDSGSDEGLINPLPRAVIRPNSFILLDGDWNFELDTENKGLIESWYISHQFTKKASWPGSVEAHMNAINPKGNHWINQVIVWYEREFPLPEMSENQSKLQLQLTFGACGYETRVWLNGFPLKTIEGEEIHKGAYTSFSYELDKAILVADNRLTVRIEGNMDADITRGKQESVVYKRGGIWYQTYTGGVRSVWLETVECNRLRSRVGLVSLVEDNLVRFNLTTRIHNPGSYQVRLRVFNKYGPDNHLVAEDVYPLILEAGQKQQRLVIEIPDAVLWSVNSPHLYLLKAQLIDAEGYIAEIETRFGLRKIEARGSAIYLNNQPVYLNGILYQPGIADYEQIKRHMHAMKALGCNLIRIHIAGVDPRIYNLADKLGLLIWVEVPSPHRSTEISRKNHKDELLRMLTLIVTHPSIIIWSLYNESWGIQDIATNTEARNYLMDMYHYMKIAYPQFLVVDNDGWQHISFEGRLKSDLLTAHLYTPDLEKWKNQLDLLIEDRSEGVTALPLIAGDPFFFRRQVPLIISEWGGFGFIAYGGPENNQEKVEKIKLFKKELKKHFIAGDIYTQATDIEEEKNGLIDFSTGTLKVPAGLLSSDFSDDHHFDQHDDHVRS